MKTFAELYGLNVSDKIEKKNGLNYLSWSYAWAEFKKAFPGAVATVYETTDPESGCVLNYFTDRRTCWVKVGVRLEPNGAETVETLPVMDYKNAAIPYLKVTACDVNKAIQRCKTKAIAEASGIGLYIYAGEDLPESAEQNSDKPLSFVCSECGGIIANTQGRNGEEIAASDVLALSQKLYKRPLCSACIRKLKAKEALKND